MDKKIGLYIFAGMAIGAVFGLFYIPVIGNGLLAVAFGAMGGVFLGWFVAIIVQQREKGNKQ